MKSPITEGTKWEERGGTGVVAELVSISTDGRVQLAIKGIEGYRIMSKGSLLSNYKPVHLVGGSELVPAGKPGDESWKDVRPLGPMVDTRTKKEKAADAGAGPVFDVRKCRVCGCTDDRACVGGCFWVEEDLCSACQAKAEEAAKTAQEIVDGVGEKLNAVDAAVQDIAAEIGKKPRAAVGRVKLADGTIITGADFITQTCKLERAKTYNVDSPIRWLLKPAGLELLKARGAAIVYGEKVG